MSAHGPNTLWQLQKELEEARIIIRALVDNPQPASVWVLTWEDYYRSSDLIGVFSSAEKAEEHAEADIEDVEWTSDSRGRHLQTPNGFYWVRQEEIR